MQELKVGMFGGGGVGKSCITLQYVRGEFTEGYIPTIEDQFNKTVKIGDKSVNLEIIDTAGQDDFAEMRFRYMQSCNGFVFVYSIIDPPSLDALEELHRDVLNATNKEKVDCIIAGNKCDMRDSKSVPLSKAEPVAAKFGCQVLETSAKTAQNINELFDTLLRIIMKKGSKGESEEAGCKCSVQ